MNADNLIMLNGRLTKDVELSKGGSTEIARFTIAVNRAFKNQDGVRDTDFHNCVAFGKTAEIISTYFEKGSMIGIIGELQDNNYQKEGKTVYGKQIKVDSFSFREYKANKDTLNQRNENMTQDIVNDGFVENKYTTVDFNDITDDDLPF